MYQSPQFQNEFPSLDGSTMGGAGVTATSPPQNTNSHDSGETQMNLRPSTDAASWMQQQNSASGRGGSENGNYPPPELAVPPKFMALLPPFLRGSAMGGASQNQQQNSGGNYQSQARQSSGRGNYGVSNYNDFSNGPPRHRMDRQGPPPRHERGRHSNNNGNNDERGSSYEPELVVQRPIIKEEELERIDSLARDDGWSKHDEIDYNKKLQFSDDEVEDVKPKDGKFIQDQNNFLL
jgi:hypothetical protein